MQGEEETWGGRTSRAAPLRKPELSPLLHTLSNPGRYFNVPTSDMGTELQGVSEHKAQGPFTYTYRKEVISRTKYVEADTENRLVVVKGEGKG